MPAKGSRRKSTRRKKKSSPIWKTLKIIFFVAIAIIAVIYLLTFLKAYM
jgi:hypothetical protein